MIRNWFLIFNYGLLIYFYKPICLTVKLTLNMREQKLDKEYNLTHLSMRE